MALEKCVNVEQINQAVDVIQKLMEKMSAADQKNPINPLDQQTINLQICFKKVPNMSNKVIKVLLPKPIVTNTTDVCLFVSDLDPRDRDFEATIRHYKDLLQSKGISRPIEVFPLKKLKLENQPFEARRNLSNMYDVFLADERILRLLPSHLGKHFYGRKRLPIQVNLKCENLKKEFERKLRLSSCMISGRGAVVMMPVARTGMTAGEIACNIKTSIDQVVNKLPGGAGNVKNMHIKTESSMAIPIYESLDGKDDIVLPKRKKKKVDVHPENVTTVNDALVKVTDEGKVHLVKLKKRPRRHAKQSTILSPPLAATTENGVVKKGRKQRPKKRKSKQAETQRKAKKAKRASSDNDTEESESKKSRGSDPGIASGDTSKRKRDEEDSPAPEAKRKGAPPILGTKRKQLADAVTEKTPNKKIKKQENSPVMNSEISNDGKVPVKGETPRGNILIKEGTPKGKTPKKEVTPKGKTPKQEGTPKGKTPNTEGTPKGQTPKQEGTPKAKTPKKKGTPKGKTPNKEGTPKGQSPKQEGTPKGKTPKKGGTPKGITLSPKKVKTPNKGKSVEVTSSEGNLPSKEQAIEDTMIKITPTKDKTPNKGRTPKKELMGSNGKPSIEANNTATPNQKKKGTPKKGKTPDKIQSPKMGKSPNKGKTPSKVKTPNRSQ